MASAASETSSYFMTLASRLGGSSTTSHSAGAARPQQQQLQQKSMSMSPASPLHRGAGAGAASSLLTQALPPPQTNAHSYGGAASNSGGGASKPTRKKPPKVGAVQLIERARVIRSQPKNTSPIDASKHPSLLPRQMMPSAIGKKCLILDVDETLVHSSYEPTHHFDLHLPLRVNGSICNVYVAYRPHLMEFIQAISPLFEVVIFTASVSMYCDPVMNAVDPQRLLGPLRLFREHCSVVNGSYVKDLSLVGRNLDTVAIIDNSPVAYLFQQRNAIPITSWFDDPDDDELLRLIPVLMELAKAPTVFDVLDNYNALIQLQQEIRQMEAMQDDL